MPFENGKIGYNIIMLKTSYLKLRSEHVHSIPKQSYNHVCVFVCVNAQHMHVPSHAKPVECHRSFPWGKQTLDR